MKAPTIDRVHQALENSWSINSSSKWKKSNPALGQCGVTALVAQDCLGGKIIKTWVIKPDVGELWHYYNLIDDELIDFTISQFDEPIGYDNLPSNRHEAFQDAAPEQYEHLSTSVEAYLQNV